MKTFPRFLLALLMSGAGAAGDDPRSPRSGPDGRGEAAPSGEPSLSPMARTVLGEITTAESLASSPVPESLLVTEGNRLERIAVDGPEIFEGFRRVLGRARHEVDMTFWAWDPDCDAAARIGEGLRKAASGMGDREPPLLVRLLVRDSQAPASGRAIESLASSVRQWDLPSDKVVMQLGTAPHYFLGALHEKLVVVDGECLIVTGANVQKCYDGADSWHDLAIEIRGPAARSALASFDRAWLSEARHWELQPSLIPALGPQLAPARHRAPERPWLLPREAASGGFPVIAVGRTATGIPNNSVQNPQDLAWLTIMREARERIHIVSPNLNDDAFQEAVIEAASRGVRVRILSSLRFNRTVSILPGQGGSNWKVFQDLRSGLLELYRSRADNLEMAWYSRDGKEPVFGNGPGANHTKYMSVDGRLSITGSGNMDTQSWNQSSEFNLLIDDAEATARLEEAVFEPDWRRAVPADLDRPPDPD